MKKDPPLFKMSDEELDAFRKRVMKPARPGFLRALSVMSGLDLERVTNIYEAMCRQWETPPVRQNWTVHHVFFNVPGVKPVKEPRAAWEAFAAESVIPFDWVEHPARRFECKCITHYRTYPARSGVKCDWCENKYKPQAYPGSWEQALLMASDVPGVLAAEECLFKFNRTEDPIWRLVPYEPSTAGDIVQVASRGKLTPAERAIYETGYRFNYFEDYEHRTTNYLIDAGIW